MPEVNIVELEKNKQPEPSFGSVEEKKINGKTYYKGPYLPTWYDNYDECIQKNTLSKRTEQLKKLGLNEHGQTEEQVKQQELIKKLLQDREAALEAVNKIDEKIAEARRGEPQKEEKKSRKKKD